MRTKTPTVWEEPWTGRVALEGGPSLDTPAWVAWLEDPTTTSFAYPVYNAARGYIEGFMTVRKEPRARRSLLDRLLARRRGAPQGLSRACGHRHRRPLARHRGRVACAGPRGDGDHRFPVPRCVRPVT